MGTSRSALITGGSRGIGAEIARQLAGEGWAVTIAARTVETLEQTARRLRSETGADVRVACADLRADSQVTGLVDMHARHFGGLDLLVLNAGTGTVGPVTDLSAKSRERMLDVNFRAPLELMQAAIPLLRKSAEENPELGAKIVAIASITGVAGEPGLAGYGATKAALISLCEAVSLEESAHGVSATAISPGYVDTDMTAWKKGELAESAMLPASDIAELVVAITRLSARAVVPNIVVSRAGRQLWRA